MSNSKFGEGVFQKLGEFLFGSIPPLALGVMHVPNYVSGRKYPFHEAVLAVVEAWPLGPGLLIGDTNSGLPGLDEETKVFGPREKGWFESLAARGWVDIFRELQGEARVYTWYSPNGGNGSDLCQSAAGAAHFAGELCLGKIGRCSRAARRLERSRGDDG